MNKLNVRALGLTLGIIWGSGMLFLGFMSTFMHWGTGVVDLNYRDAVRGHEF